jgi:hypothetical protein
MPARESFVRILSTPPPLLNQVVRWSWTIIVRV